MTHQQLSTYELLKERKKWLQEEIRQVDMALAGMQAGVPFQKQEHVKSRPSDGVQWSDKIDEVFDNYNGELNFEEIKERLIGLGLQEAGDKKYKPSINACLSRKVKQTKLYRPRAGYYRKKSKDATLFDEDHTQEIQ